MAPSLGTVRERPPRGGIQRASKGASNGAFNNRASKGIKQGYQGMGIQLEEAMSLLTCAENPSHDDGKDDVRGQQDQIYANSIYL